MRIGTSAENVGRDFAYAARALIRTPTFTAVTVLTLALGIGVNTAIFTVLNLWLRPLQVHEPANLVHLTHQVPGDGYDGFSRLTYDGLVEHSTTLAPIASAKGDVLMDAQPNDERGRVSAMYVSDNYFAVLRAPVARGQLFATSVPTAPALAGVVLSYRLWDQAFGADPDIVGRSVVLNGARYIVTGVTARGFIGLSHGPNLSGPDLWLPLTASTKSSSGLHERWLTLSGRLAPGRTSESAKAEMNALLHGVTGTPTAEPRQRIDVRRASRLPGEHPEEFLGMMGVVLFASGLVLLIACANLANMMLVRGAQRYKEITARMCLGATRARIIVLLLAESSLLAALGGVCGLLLAMWSLESFMASGLFSLAGADAAMLYETALNLTPDVRVLGYTFLLSLLAVGGCGILPAVRCTRWNLNNALKADGPNVGGSLRHSRLRSTLILVQVAVSMTLLVTAGILVRGVGRAGQVDPGFDATGVLAVVPRTDVSGYSDARAREYRARLLASLAQLPGASIVSLTTAVPLQQRRIADVSIIDARTGERSMRVTYSAVSHGYFETLGIPISRGRPFTHGEASAGTPLAIVSESSAKLFWPDRDPLGQELRIDRSIGSGGARRDRETARVVGVAKDSQNVRLGEFDPTFVYLPLRDTDGATILVRGADSTRLAQAIGTMAQGIDARVPCDVRSLSAIAASTQVAATRVASAVAVALGALALTLAAVGLYGVVKYSVHHRTREIGIRTALGANPRDLLALIMREALQPVGMGAAIGVLLGGAAAHLLSSIIFGLSPLDPLTYIGASAVLITVAVGASYGPARRALHVQPIVALRQS